MKKLFILLFILFSTTIGYSADEWDKASPDGETLINDIDTIVGENNVALDRLLAHEKTGMALVYDSATQFTVTAGSVTCSDSTEAVRKMRYNSSNTTVVITAAQANGFATGESESTGTRYYVYADCDADATTATFRISASSTAPPSVTYYNMVGTFYNDASGNISQTKFTSKPYSSPFSDSQGRHTQAVIQSYGTSSSAYTLQQVELKVAYGTVSVAGASSTSISNLPFTSTASYGCSATHSVSGDLKKASCSKSSATALSVLNEHPDTRSINWIAIGY